MKSIVSLKNNRVTCGLFFLVYLMALPLFSLDEGEIENWINGKREAARLNPLGGESFLYESARSYGEELMTRGILSHRGNGGQGPMERYRTKGGTALAVGEILGTCSSDAPEEELLEAWWNSPEHRDVIMDPRWTSFGCVLTERAGVVIAVVEFSSSLISDYVWRREGHAFLLSFIPCSGAGELIFTEPLKKRRRIWKIGENPSILMTEEDFPLLLEIESPIYDPELRRGNRLLLLDSSDGNVRFLSSPETDHEASAPLYQFYPGG